MWEEGARKNSVEKNPWMRTFVEKTFPENLVYAGIRRMPFPFAPVTTKTGFFQPFSDFFFITFFAQLHSRATHSSYILIIKMLVIQIIVIIVVICLSKTLNTQSDTNTHTHSPSPLEVAYRALQSVLCRGFPKRTR